MLTQQKNSIKKIPYKKLMSPHTAKKMAGRTLFLNKTGHDYCDTLEQHGYQGGETYAQQWDVTGY